MISAMLVFAIVFGLSVEDLSERGGAFLGVDDLSFARPVHVGDTLTARSTVLALRESKSDRNYGIATWLTEGFNQHGERVIVFKIGRAHVWTPVTNAHLVCRLLLDNRQPI